MKFFISALMLLLPLSAIVLLATGCFDENKEHEKQLEKIKAYISEKGLTNVITTSSGLSYKILRTDTTTTTRPVSTSLVDCHYKGYLLDGTVFDQHQPPQNAISFRLNQVIAGWTEGIPKLRKGEKGLFIIPSRLGYGSQAQSSIPANSVLVFEVDLVAFIN